MLFLRLYTKSSLCTKYFVYYGEIWLLKKTQLYRIRRIKNWQLRHKNWWLRYLLQPWI